MNKKSRTLDECARETMTAKEYVQLQINLDKDMIYDEMLVMLETLFILAKGRIIEEVQDEIQELIKRAGEATK